MCGFLRAESLWLRLMMRGTAFDLGLDDSVVKLGAILEPNVELYSFTA